MAAPPPTVICSNAPEDVNKAHTLARTKHFSQLLLTSTQLFMKFFLPFFRVSLSFLAFHVCLEWCEWMRPSLLCDTEMLFACWIVEMQ